MRIVTHPLEPMYDTQFVGFAAQRLADQNSILCVRLYYLTIPKTMSLQ